MMRKTNQTKSIKEESYRRKQILSSILYLLSGLGVLGFGIYFMEIFELVGGVLLVIVSLMQFSSSKKRYKEKLIEKKERAKLKFLVLAIGVYSLVNPIGIIPVLYDLYKRDFAMRGDFDE